MRWQWHQLDHIQIICTSLQTDNHARTPTTPSFAGQMPFLPPNQQHQSTEGTSTVFTVYLSAQHKALVFNLLRGRF